MWCLAAIEHSKTTILDIKRSQSHSLELAELQEFIEKQNSIISKYLVQRRITWSFISPRAPHCGGLWEAAVKVAKQRLNAVTEVLTLIFEESHTLLTEIDAVMTSRPLTPLSSDRASLEVLTPAHFLINDSLIQPQFNLNYWTFLIIVRVDGNCSKRLDKISKKGAAGSIYKRFKSVQSGVLEVIQYQLEQWYY